jgi:hypothetical protein
MANQSGNYPFRHRFANCWCHRPMKPTKYYLAWLVADVWTVVRCASHTDAENRASDYPGAIIANEFNLRHILK